MEEATKTQATIFSYTSSHVPVKIHAIAIFFFHHLYASLVGLQTSLPRPSFPGKTQK